MIKNFDSFINESNFNLSGIPEIAPEDLTKSIQSLEPGKKILVFTNWAAAEYAIPRMCKAFNKDNYVQITAGDLSIDSFDLDQHKLNLPKAENMLIYVEEIERAEKEMFKSLMAYMLSDSDNKYVVSVNINDDNANTFMHSFTNNPAFKDRFNKIVLCK